MGKMRVSEFPPISDARAGLPEDCRLGQALHTCYVLEDFHGLINSAQ